MSLTPNIGPHIVIWYVHNCYLSEAEAAGGDISVYVTLDMPRKCESDNPPPWGASDGFPTKTKYIKIAGPIRPELANHICVQLKNLFALLGREVAFDECADD